MYNTVIMVSSLLKIFVKDYQKTQDASVRANVGRLSGTVGIILNLLLAGFKIVVGLIFGAISVLADGLNNLSDCGSNIISLIGFKLAGKPADKDHPYGHQRMEYVASLMVGVVVITLALQLLSESVSKLISPEQAAFSWWTIAALGVSVAVKLWLYVFNRRLGRSYNSELLCATATDSISDACATVAILIAVVVIKFTGWTFLDGAMGIVVSVVIAFAGIGIIRNTMSSLLGEAPDKQLAQDICKRVLAYNGVLGVHDLNVHNYGPSRYYASLHVEVDSRVDVMESHELIDSIERDFAENTDIMLVIHLDPIVVGDPELDAYKKELIGIVAELDKQFSLHDLRMVKGPTATNLIFDVAITFDTRLTDREIAEYIQTEMSRLHSNVHVVPNVEKINA